MKVSDIIHFLDTVAPPSLQESYDNVGLLVGDAESNCSGVICCLDVTDAILDESLEKGCNLIVAHHPLIFDSIKQINANEQTGRLIIKAIQHNISIYAIHTNLDNVLEGVNGKMAALLGLTQCSVLLPKPGALKKLITFIPLAQVEQVRAALFFAGAGQIGQYDECSFSCIGEGTFKAAVGATPYVGETGVRHTESEVKLELIYPFYLESNLLNALKSAHPYQEVAYDLIPLSNAYQGVGAGVIGELSAPQNAAQFLRRVSEVFKSPLVRYTNLLDKPIQKVALCGGAGGFLINAALCAGAQAFITADLKYHDFFKATGKLVLADIGHFESEQFTIDLLQERLAEKFPTFAVLKASVSTNPVNYLWHK
ncbi:MAG: Nif3-like dinuclear metal center hexameric protein [Bacteroidetes bacterium]|nr:Nif3-like dinuclear metal center hexameric protein [Bacteroidota bacterium]